MLNPEDIIPVVEETFGLRPGMLTAKNKAQRVTRCRWLAMGLILAARPDMTYSEVGRALGLDHSSVSHGMKRLLEVLAQEPGVRTTWNALRRRLGLPVSTPGDPLTPVEPIDFAQLEVDKPAIRITIEFNQKGEVLVPALLEFLAKHSAQAREFLKSWEKPI